MRVDQIERVVGKWQVLAVGFAQIGLQPLLLEVLPRQRDRGRRQIDARDDRAAAREPRQIRPGAASHFEHPPPGIPLEVDESQQMVQLLEVVLIEIGEEARRCRPGAS